LRETRLARVKDYRGGETVRVLRVPLPAYLRAWQEAASLLLAVFLSLMLASEPAIRCLGHSDGDFEGRGLFTAGRPSLAERFPSQIAYAHWLCLISTSLHCDIVPCL